MKLFEKIILSFTLAFNVSLILVFITLLINCRTFGEGLFTLLLIAFSIINCFGIIKWLTWRKEEPIIKHKDCLKKVKK